MDRCGIFSEWTGMACTVSMAYTVSGQVCIYSEWTGVAYTVSGQAWHIQ